MRFQLRLPQQAKYLEIQNLAFKAYPKYLMKLYY